MNDWLYQGSKYVGSEEMICVGLDCDNLQEKMMEANLDICQRCIGDKDDKILEDGAFLHCREMDKKGKKLNLVEEKYLPVTCPYKMEHIVMRQKIKLSI